MGGKSYRCRTADVSVGGLGSIELDKCGTADVSNNSGLGSTVDSVLGSIELNTRGTAVSVNGLSSTADGALGSPVELDTCDISACCLEGCVAGWSEK